MAFRARKVFGTLEKQAPGNENGDGREATACSFSKEISMHLNLLLMLSLLSLFNINFVAGP